MDQIMNSQCKEAGDDENEIELEIILKSGKDTEISMRDPKGSTFKRTWTNLLEAIFC